MHKIHPKYGYFEKQKKRDNVINVINVKRETMVTSSENVVLREGGSASDANEYKNRYRNGNENGNGKTKMKMKMKMKMKIQPQKGWSRRSLLSDMAF